MLGVRNSDENTIVASKINIDDRDLIIQQNMENVRPSYDNNKMRGSGETDISGNFNNIT